MQLLQLYVMPKVFEHLPHFDSLLLNNRVLPLKEAFAIRPLPFEPLFCLFQLVAYYAVSLETLDRSDEKDDHVGQEWENEETGTRVADVELGIDVTNEVCEQNQVIHDEHELDLVEEIHLGLELWVSHFSWAISDDHHDAAHEQTKHLQPKVLLVDNDDETKAYLAHVIECPNVKVLLVLVKVADIELTMCLFEARLINFVTVAKQELDSPDWEECQAYNHKDCGHMIEEAPVAVLFIYDMEL